MSLLDWTNPSAIGYPVLFGGVLLGSVVPVVPTGAIVGAAAAVATTTDDLNLMLVVLLSTVAALLGDLVTFAAGRGGRGTMTRWFVRRQSEERLASARTRFTRRAWQLIVIGRMVPAGRIPVLLAAGALDYPWRRLAPTAAGACLLWAVAYAALGVVSGGLFDNALLATIIAALLVIVVTLLLAWMSRLRERGRAAKVTTHRNPT